ncbi:MAG: DUF1573 domain-containing protein [Bacteroidetes bacterium]|nr:DUF1573 domain-containing protein [Bacteroidota bacterium]
MKPFFHSVFVLLFAAASLCAQQARFDATEKDLGEIPPLSSARTEFVLYNGGAEVLHLMDPKPSCGCTATLLSNSELAPGDSAVIGVRFSAAPGMMGPMSKTIAIRAQQQGGEVHLATLRINVNIVGSVRYEPGMLRFDAVVGDTVRLALRLYAKGDASIPLRDVSAALLAYIDTTEGNKYHVDVVQTKPFTAFDFHIPASEIAPGDSTEIFLTLRPEHKGQINGSLRIPIPDGELRVPVVGVVLRTRAP